MNKIGGLTKRPGLGVLSSQDDSGASFSYTYRLCPTNAGLAALAGSWSLYQLNESNSGMVNKGRMPEYSVNKYVAGSNTSPGMITAGIAGDANGTVLDTAISSKYAAIAYPINGSAYSSVVIAIIDRKSQNVIRTYNTVVWAQNPWNCCLTFVDDRYLHVYLQETGTTNVKMFQLDSNAWPLESATPASINCFFSGSATIYLVGCIAISGSSIVVATDTGAATGKVERFTTVPASAATQTIGATFNVGGFDVGGGTLYLLGTDVTPSYVIKKLNASTLAVTSTVTDAAATTVRARARIAVDGSDNCRIVAFGGQTTVLGGPNLIPVAEVYSQSGAGNFSIIAYLPSWVEGTMPWYDSTTGRFYTCVIKKGTYVTGGGVADTNIGDWAVVDITSTVNVGAAGNLWGFRPVATLDSFVGRSTQSAGSNGIKVSIGGLGLLQKPKSSGSTRFVGVEYAATSTARGYYGAELTPFVPADITSDGDFLSGAVGTCIDNHEVQELGFIDIPSAFLADSGAGGGPGAGNYNYAVVYEYLDASGRAHFSRTSTVSSITMAGGNQISVQVTLPGVVSKKCLYPQGWFFSVSAKVFRTTNNGQIYYLVDTLNVSPGPIPKFFFGTLADATSDATLITRPKLYRQPGISGTPLDRFPPPPSVHLCRHKDRLVYAHMNNAYYTSFFVDGEAPWCNPAFTIYFPGGQGYLTGLASMDGQLIAWKRNAIYVVDGDGPPENGGNGTEFSPPRRIATEYGCIDPRSIVLMPDGIMYRSIRGIELLTRGLQVVFIGQMVQSTMAQYPYVMGAVYDRATGRVLITCASSQTSDGRASGSGVTLVYDTTVQDGAWYTFKHYNSIGNGGPWQDVCYARVYSSSSDTERVCWGDPGASYIFYDHPTTNTDNGHYAPYKIETGWIKLSTTQGRIQFDGLALLAKKISNHNVTISVAYDYSDTYAQSVTYKPSLLNTLDLEQLLYSLNNGIYTAIRFKIEDSQPDDTVTFPIGTGQGMDILSLTVKAGPMEGFSLVAQEQSA